MMWVSSTNFQSVARPGTKRSLPWEPLLKKTRVWWVFFKITLLAASCCFCRFRLLMSASVPITSFSLWATAPPAALSAFLSPPQPATAIATTIKAAMRKTNNFFIIHLPLLVCIIWLILLYTIKQYCARFLLLNEFYNSPCQYNFMYKSKQPYKYKAWKIVINSI